MLTELLSGSAPLDNAIQNSPSDMLLSLTSKLISVTSFENFVVIPVVSFIEIEVGVKDKIVPWLGSIPKPG